MVEIDDELKDLMQRAEAIFGEAECAAAMDRALERAHRDRRAASAQARTARIDSGALAPGAFEAAFRAELMRMLRPQ